MSLRSALTTADSTNKPKMIAAAKKFAIAGNVRACDGNAGVLDMEAKMRA
jgi:hypothetical protein